MPELPDLQVFSHNLHAILKGKQLQEIKVLKAKKLNVSAAVLEKALAGQKLSKVARSGKELSFEFANDNILSLHLMLHGKLILSPAPEEHKHTILQLIFTDGTSLSLTDYSSMAKPTLNPEPASAPDALSKEGGIGFLKEQLPQKRTSIKNFLLDQHIIRGIGNAYADEILWDARISPFSICNKIPAAKITQLAKSIKKVLEGAEKKIRKAHPDIISGEIRDFLLIHNAKKEKSPDGAVIHHKMVNSRKTYYTDEQELFE